MNSRWYEITNESSIDSPALLVYPSRVTENIEAAITIVGDAARLMPHGKTHKTMQGFTEMIQRGIKRFKCATIVELQLACRAGASMVLLSYQPVGPKIDRLIETIRMFPNTGISCLVDDAGAVLELDRSLQAAGLSLDVYIDLNIGMNRTGISTDRAMPLYQTITESSRLHFKGLHAYDGHIKVNDFKARKAASDKAFEPVVTLRHAIENAEDSPIELIAGGSPTFPVHALYADRTCSPGTFIFWDRGYELACPDQPFKPAIVLLCRVISIPADRTICIDLGHKAVAAENEITRRVYFPDLPDAIAISQSEEHLVLKTNNAVIEVGDVVYGIPYHVCPTVALHDRMLTVIDQRAAGEWKVERGR